MIKVSFTSCFSNVFYLLYQCVLKLKNSVKTPLSNVHLYPLFLLFAHSLFKILKAMSS